MKNPLILILLLFVACTKPAVDSQKIEREIRSVMDRQVAGWNEHRLDLFMEYYWKSSGLTFYTGEEKVLGWDTIRKRYEKRYAGEEMGILTFDEIKVNIITEETAYVLGRWKVELPDTVRKGRFTIIFRKLDEGWRIIHDHSS